MRVKVTIDTEIKGKTCGRCFFLDWENGECTNPELTDFNLDIGDNEIDFLRMQECLERYGNED